MALSIKFDGAWGDVGRVIDAGQHIEVVCLSKGMASGRPSVAIRLKLPDGRYVFAQCSMREFVAAAKAMEARFEDDLKR